MGRKEKLIADLTKMLESRKPAEDNRVDILEKLFFLIREYFRDFEINSKINEIVAYAEGLE